MKKGLVLGDLFSRSVVKKKVFKMVPGKRKGLKWPPTKNRISRFSFNHGHLWKKTTFLGSISHMQFSPIRHVIQLFCMNLKQKCWMSANSQNGQSYQFEFFAQLNVQEIDSWFKGAWMASLLPHIVEPQRIVIRWEHVKLSWIPILIFLI